MSTLGALVDAAVQASKPALSGRRILLGVSGGIAAYKAAELARLFIRAGADVRVVMSHAATELIGPLTFQSLTGHTVTTSLFEAAPTEGSGSTIGHIELADWAELFVIAPATANVIARLVHGLADDVLTTIVLACRAPLLVAPAMNVNMWRHEATQANVAALVKRGVHKVGPDEGDLACGWVGAGRMAEPLDLLEAAANVLGPRAMVDEHVLVTAGPTHEPIDPVRYIGNRSTGKMGFSIAAEAAARGAKVTLVAGPTPLPTPPGVDRVDVVTAADLREAVLARCEDASLIVMAAAVADERPATPAAHKLKKSGAASSLALAPTADVLAELGTRTWKGKRPTLVGFAAETQDLVANATAKLERKRCDLVVANDVSASDAGFGTDSNRVVLVRRGAPPEALPLLDKRQVAGRILDAVKGLGK
jgi:phosphopantothenoylcysteine decarboxylase/phosphopantothenate--cysteine ligase